MRDDMERLQDILEAGRGVVTRDLSGLKTQISAILAELSGDL